MVTRHEVADDAAENGERHSEWQRHQRAADPFEREHQEGPGHDAKGVQNHFERQRGPWVHASRSVSS